MIRRFVSWWLTCRDPSGTSGRAWARELGISHTWVQKLVRELRQIRAKCGGYRQQEETPNLQNLVVHESTRRR